jgi:RNA polymerase sigma-B factor
VPRTTPNAERELFARLRAAPTPENREAAVKRYLPLAHALAARYGYAAEPLEDLQQVAAIGLINAIDRFDPDRGKAFTSFAVPTILGELRRHFRDRTWPLRVPRDQQELFLALDRARDELSVTLGRAPTVAELARWVGAGEEAVLHAMELTFARSTLPLAPRDPDDDEEGEDLPGAPDDGYRHVEDHVMLVPLLATLSAGDAQVLMLRFSEDLTQDAIARRLGVSQMTVSRALRRSLARLRDAAR